MTTPANVFSPSSSAWLAGRCPRADAGVRLFCLPYAGGGSRSFQAWQEAVPANIEICPIELPGRGNRLAEPAFHHIRPMVAAVARGIRSCLDRPFALFGHSMGAIVAFELAQLLRHEHGLQPLHLFVSARRAPHLPVRESPVHDLPEPEFIAELRRLNGTPREVLEHRELMALMIPTLRADFSVCHTYDYRPAAPLACPITAFGGIEDVDVGREALEGWRLHTAGPFALRMVPGGHFYLQIAQPHLLTVIARELGGSRPARQSC